MDRCDCDTSKVTRGKKGLEWDRARVGAMPRRRAAGGVESFSVVRRGEGKGRGRGGAA